ncbi:THxN family PEP-CTERM protein [Oscillatoria sp. FACHB-1407]|uniref:THxN family PEP-CTERM protein n=1 Tax=Oscillatoria sp. FACHB-1407 TaxID=2692847 RepID=UPI0030D8B8A4
MTIATASAIALTSLPETAIATTLLSASGTWENPIGGEPTVEQISMGDEAMILWGTATTPDGKSGLGYLGVGASDIASDIPFLVGTLRHFNNPVAPPNVSSVELLINLNLADVGGSLVSRSFTFAFAVDETVNATPCLYASTIPCADRISFLNPTTSETFDVAGTAYTLELLGFSDRPTPDGAFVNEFISEEQATNTAFLFGKLTAAVPRSVPEPGAIVPLALLGICLGIRGKDKKSRMKDKK